MSNEEAAVVVKDLYKSFRLPHEQHSGIKQMLINFTKRKKGYEVQHVLDDVSFEIQKGEFFAIVGRNGSGKSTLLKLLAGIYAPDKGLVQINGSLTPFIELGVGFNPELTGRENVFLNGALLGFSRKEMEVMYQDIVSFAELERFMDQKLKNYSSGMQVRLAFSIAIRAQSDILLLDEVLAVGDSAFQQKCFEYFDTLKENKQTIILVTHDMNTVRQFCDKAMLVSEGKVLDIGETEKISALYEKLNYQDYDNSSEEETNAASVALADVSGKAREMFEYGEEVNIDVRWPASIKKVGIVGIVVYKGTEVVFATNTLNQAVDLTARGVRLTIKQSLGNGRYKVQAVLFGRNRHDVMENSQQVNLGVFNQPDKGANNDEWQGITYIDHSWRNYEEDDRAQKKV